MRYTAFVAASAALVLPALAVPQEAGAGAPGVCSSTCGRDEQIQTECNGAAACMCSERNFFPAWKDCRSCLRRENQLSESAHAKAVEAINAVSTTFCASGAAPTRAFQALWEEVAGGLGMYEGDSAAVAVDSAASPVGGIRGTSAGAPGAVATAVARASAGAGGSGNSATASAVTVSTRVSPGSASRTNAASAGRGGNSTIPAVNGNAANAGKAMSCMAVAAAGVAVVLAL